VAVVLKRRFSRIVEEALAELPSDLADAVENVALMVADRPDRETLVAAGVPDGETLLGLFEGVPLPDQDVMFPSPYPPRVTLFRLEIQNAARRRGGGEAALREVIRETLVHELAHYFGFDEDEIAERGYG
jgi:predicted Zn-dependent protease with MMP-like domain